LFERPAEVYQPQTQRQGYVAQITGRAYTKKQLYTTEKQARELADGTVRTELVVTPTTFFHQSVAALDALARKHHAHTVGIVCYQALESLYAEAMTAKGYTVRTLHYYKMRGSNDLEAVDVMFLLGTPAPRPTTVINTATALNPQHRAPFYAHDAAGQRVPEYTLGRAEYRLTAEGLARAIARFGLPSDTQGIAHDVGLYGVHELAAVCEAMREGEATQGVHRGRPNVHPTPVYILTHTPLTDIPLDDLFIDPPIAPDGINWRTWFKLTAILAQCAPETLLYADDIARTMEISAAYVAREHWLAAIAGADIGWTQVKRRKTQAARRGATPAAILKGVAPAEVAYYDLWGALTFEDYALSFVNHRAVLTLK